MCNEHPSYSHQGTIHMVLHDTLHKTQALNLLQIRHRNICVECRLRAQVLKQLLSWSKKLLHKRGQLNYAPSVFLPCVIRHSLSALGQVFTYESNVHDSKEIYECSWCRWSENRLTFGLIGQHTVELCWFFQERTKQNIPNAVKQNIPNAVKIVLIGWNTIAYVSLRF